MEAARLNADSTPDVDDQISASQKERVDRLAVWVYVRRLKLGLGSQGELAQRSGLSLSTIQRVEASKSNISSYTIEQLAKALQADPAELFRHLAGERDENIPIIEPSERADIFDEDTERRFAGIYGDLLERLSEYERAFFQRLAREVNGQEGAIIAAALKLFLSVRAEDRHPFVARAILRKEMRGKWDESDFFRIAPNWLKIVPDDIKNPDASSAEKEVGGAAQESSKPA